MNFKQLYLSESNSKTLIIVDIQPAYAKNIRFNISDFVKFLAESDYQNYLYLYNGPELGFESEEDIKYWLYEHSNEAMMEELDKVKWFEKNYAFFRNAMDNGTDEDDIIKVAKKLIQKHENDSRDLSEEDWEELGIESFGEDNIYIPDVLDVLKKYNNIDICGGDQNECLKEVEICLDILGKSYTQVRKFIF